MTDKLSGATTAAFVVGLSQAVDEPVTVDWRTQDGSGKAGIDYEAASGEVTFLPGETTKVIEVTVYGRAEGDSAEGRVFYVRLNPPANAILSNTLTECVITVSDDNGVPVTSVVVAQGKRGLKGDPGLSAYEQAVLMGYQGTIEEWMQEIGSAAASADRAAELLSATEVAATKAEAAAASAAFSGRIFQTPEQGVDPVTGVPVGNYFNVRSPSDDAYLDEYQNNNGTPTATGKSYPSSQAIEKAITSTFTVESEAELLALNAMKGNIGIIKTEDERVSLVLREEPCSIPENWEEIARETSKQDGTSSILVGNILELKSASWVAVGQLYDVLCYHTHEAGGRSTWRAVEALSVEPNGIDIIQSEANPEIAFVIQLKNGMIIDRQLGALPGTDVTAILNRAYSMANVNVVILTALSPGEVFQCSDKIVAGKTTIGINKPIYDFSNSPTGTDSWAFESLTSPRTHNFVYEGFEIRNSQFRAVAGAGDNVKFRDLIIRDASEQAIGWEGSHWKVENVQIYGTKKSYDIVIGGVSDDVEVHGCHIEGAVTMGGIEPAYSSRNVNIHHNTIRLQPYGVLVWVRTPNGTDKLSKNVVIDSNIFSELSKGGVWIRSEETDFTAESVSVTNNVFSSNNADSAFAIRVGGWDKVFLCGNQIHDYNVPGAVGILVDDYGERPTGNVVIRDTAFENMQQCFIINVDGVVIDGATARNVLYDFVAYPFGNTFASCKVKNCVASYGRDALRNFSLRSLRHLSGNSFKIPFSGAGQLNGATVDAGDRFYVHPPVPGSAEGVVCIAGGVVGAGAVMKNFGSVAS